MDIPRAMDCRRNKGIAYSAVMINGTPYLKPSRYVLYNVLIQRKKLIRN
jgi:hypothetical protein